MTPKLVKLTPKQLSDWDDTRAALMWYAPALTHVFYTLMDAKNGYIVQATDDDELFPTAATDGKTIIVNVNRFFKYPLMERLFILAHEILHNILDHIRLLYQSARRNKVMLSDGRILPFSEPHFQMAMDLVINAILVDAKIGKLPEDCTLFDTGIATHLDSVIDVYGDIFRNADPGIGPGSTPPEDRPGEPSVPGGFDKHLAPGALEGKQPMEAVDERNEEEWRTTIQAALEMAQAQGKLPAGLQRLFEEIVESKVDWTDAVRAIFARRVGNESVNWRKPDRRLIVRDIWAPSRSGYGAELIIVANDTSGSISQGMISMWLGEIGGILEQLRPRQTMLIWCDAAIGRVDEIEDVADLADVKKKGAPGGGGTDFRPVFDYITKQRLEPDALVFLTDGYGTFPTQTPRYPVVWGSIAEKPDKYPFGDVVMLPQ